MKSSSHELHFLEVTVLQMVEFIFSPLFSYTLTIQIIIEFLIFDNLVGENMYFIIFPQNK